MTATLKRGLSLSVLALIIGLVSCTTVAPSVALSGPPGPYFITTPVTLTATGSPGSAAGLWTYSFSASPACGTFAPAMIGPTNLTTVTTTFTPTVPTVDCTLRVTLTTASGRTATASITRTVVAAPPPPIPSLPACAIVSLTDSVGSGATDNFGPMTGAAAGNRAWGYVQGPSDSILRLMAAPTGAWANCPGGSIACDDDDGAFYTPTPPAVLPGTIPSTHAGNSLLGNVAMTAGTNVWTVNGYGGGAMANYNFFGHFTNIDFTEAEPNGTIATANNVPAVPNWRIGGSITAGDADYFAFTAAADDVIFVVVAPDPTLDSVIQLRDSTDAVLVSVDGGYETDPEGYAVRLTVGGTYYIRVSPYEDATGSYRLTACRQ